MDQNKISRGTALPNLKPWRLAKGLSQAALSQSAGVSEQSIIRLEKPGTYSYGCTIRRISAALGITPEALVREDPAA